MSDNHFLFQNLAKQLDLICQKEGKLTENMRHLADQADDLFDDIASLKTMLEQSSFPMPQHPASAPIEAVEHQTTKVDPVAPSKIPAEKAPLASDEIPSPLKASESKVTSTRTSYLAAASAIHRSSLNYAGNEIKDVKETHFENVSQWPNDREKSPQYSERKQSSYFRDPVQ